MFKYILRFEYLAGIDIVIIPNIRQKHPHNGFPEKIKRPMYVEALGIFLTLLYNGLNTINSLDFGFLATRQDLDQIWTRNFG